MSAIRNSLKIKPPCVALLTAALSSTREKLETVNICWMKEWKHWTPTEIHILYITIIYLRFCNNVYIYPYMPKKDEQKTNIETNIFPSIFQYVTLVTEQINQECILSEIIS